MYSQKIIQKNRKRAESIIRERHNLYDSWTLQPASDQDRATMGDLFNSLLDNKGYMIRDYTLQERLWVLCEWTLCKIDFLYFAHNYVKIEDWTGRVVPFRENKAQRIILDLMADNEEKAFAQMMMFLKARQLGITTLFQILLAHRTFFYRNVGAYTGSAEEKKSREMVGKLEFLWNNLPWWLRPRRTSYRAGELLEYADLNSSINVQWGNQKGGIARGATPVVAHLSELSTFIDPESLVDASLANAMHENPFALLGLESTANGLGNWWHKTWDYNTRMDSRGLARYKPVFLPWYIGDDLYPTTWEYKRRPAPDGWTAPEYVERHALAAQTYVRSTPTLRKSLGQDWSMPLKQKWWYYLRYEEARELKELHLLLQELPASADEAFQNSNPSVFSIEVLSNSRTVASASLPQGTYQVSGVEIPFIYSDQKTVGSPIEVHCMDSDETILERFSLDPISSDSWPDPDPDLKLFVWEWPQSGETYAVYCDPSEGVGEDSSVVGVIKKATPWHPDEQVAEWASNKVAPHDLWAYIYCLAHLYTVKDPYGYWQEPLVVIETNIAAGDAAQTEMLKRGYGNFHQERDFTLVGSSGTSVQSRPKSVRERIGWRTTRANRPRMLSLFRKMVRDKTFVVRSPFLVQEMATLEYNLDRQRIEASEGRHDDRVMAAALVLCSWYDPETYGTEPIAYTEQRAFETLIARVPTYMGDKMIGGRAYHSEPPPDRSDSRGLY